MFLIVSYIFSQVRTAVWGEWEAETGIDANRGTDPRSPGKAGTTCAGSDSKVVHIQIQINDISN